MVVLRPMATTMTSRLALLGGRTSAAFLRDFWQKDSLLVRGAMADFGGLHSRNQLQTLAGRDDVESRLVVRAGRGWSLAHGPFRRADWKALPARGWTLLVQGVNLHDDRADALLRRFSFLPYARLDDVMVSYAAPGGGVGPHCDSYDVFLLQGSGRRRWRYGRQRDVSLRRGLPVKILRRFTPTHDEVLGPGDLLYLPPACAHDGVAVDAGTTYSIGFRAATHTELAQQFLDYLRDRIDLPGRYADPDAKPSAEPARVAPAMQRRAAATLAAIRWDRPLVARFLGTAWSEPKASVFFSRPAAPMTRAAFAAKCKARGAHLDRRTVWLYDDEAIYINGEALAWPQGDRAALMMLANRRALAAARCIRCSDGIMTFLYENYRHGYLHPA